MIGKCWFGVWSKSFEILVEVVEEKVIGRALERGHGFSSYIKFREKSLFFFVVGCGGLLF